MTLKKQINREAEMRRRKISTPLQFKKGSVAKVLELLNPKIEEIFELEKNIKYLWLLKN